MNFTAPRRGGLLVLSACVALAVGAARPRPTAKSVKAPAKVSAKTVPAHSPTQIAAMPLPKTSLGPPPKGLAADPATKDADLVFDYSSDWQGYLEPCG